MVSPELGTKRTCPNCGARFYDLHKDPLQCPKCGTSFEAMPILPSKGDFSASQPLPPLKNRESVELDEVDTGDIELISLEDVEEDGKDDDETAGIEDVDMGDDAEPGDTDEDDSFLVVEEEEGDNVTGLLDSGKPANDENEEEV